MCASKREQNDKLSLNRDVYQSFWLNLTAGKDFAPMMSEKTNTKQTKKGASNYEFQELYYQSTRSCARSCEPGGTPGAASHGASSGVLGGDEDWREHCEVHFPETGYERTASYHAAGSRNQQPA